jgi:S-adenosylmethionine-diacylgycerolhomoserine-N-methlytransferase
MTRMGLVSDLRVLYHMAVTPVRGATHAERLESFYSGQSGAYDDFRRRLLHGREEMLSALEFPEGGRWLDMGGGTGHNVEAIGDRRARLAEVTVVDLCPSLLQIAEERIKRNGWNNVRTATADACTYAHAAGPVDTVTFSYSLTMIPNWFQALRRAYDQLRPGGAIGVVDFYISRKWPAAGMRRHSAFKRFLWPHWFGFDNVFLSPDHLPMLQTLFATERLEERLGRVPYLLGIKAPYYVFAGRKSGA